MNANATPDAPHAAHRISPAALLAVAAAVCAFPAAGADLLIAPCSGDSAPAAATAPASLAVAFPGEAVAELSAPDPAEWVSAGRLRLELAAPPDLPPGAQVLVQVRDWDSLSFQTLLPDALLPGATNHLDVDVGPYAAAWEPLGHPGAWNRRSLLRPERVAVCLFEWKSAYTGAVEIVAAAVELLADDSPPAFRSIRTTEATPADPPVDGRYELRFDLPDRYANPFDPDEIAVDAEIRTPSGAVASVPCFYYQEFAREGPGPGDRVLPQGRPEWRLRYAPAEEGPHEVSLIARDRFGETRLDRAALFTAAPASTGAMRMVHVSARDPRHFEDAAGRSYFPIGCNIRSPHDVRMDERFPDISRHPEGSLSYARRFEAMGRSGMNFAEVWSSAWSLGLEWSVRKRGYHGVGQYNLANAWERDRMFEMAAANGVRISLVLNNHGRLSTYSDSEWGDNPYNASFPEGWCDSPETWFADPRALACQEKLLRYEIARYSWNANLFAWQLWSELNLVGSERNNRASRDPAVLAWHERMIGYLHRHDPNRHPVSTHTSGDYKNMPAVLANVGELDHVCVDAYHSSPDPLHIRDLMNESKRQNHLADRPLLVTEFGGSWQGSSVAHLRREIHAALWDAVPSGLAGTPMCWWWHMIEEFDLYPAYAAFARFVAGEDLANPELMPGPKGVSVVPPTVPEGAPTPKRVVVDACLGPSGGYAWLHAPSPRYAAIDPDGEPVHTGYRLAIPAPDLDGRVYTFEFWDTLKGEPVRLVDARVRSGRAEAPIPPFARDIAVKIRLRPEDIRSGEEP